MWQLWYFTTTSYLPQHALRRCCRHPAGILLVREDSMHGPGSEGYAVLATASSACIAMDALQYSVRVAES